MQLAFLPHTLAPLGTGHPLTLPPLQRAAAAQKRVQPVDATPGGTTTQTGQRPSEPEVPLPGRDNPDRAAPPSLMQIRITQMLEDQAKAQMPDPAKPVEPPAKAEETREATDPQDPTEADAAPELEPSATPTPQEDPRRAYEEAVTLSRSSVFKTLP